MQMHCCGGILILGMQEFGLQNIRKRPGIAGAEKPAARTNCFRKPTRIGGHDTASAGDSLQRDDSKGFLPPGRDGAPPQRLGGCARGATG